MDAIRVLVADDEELVRHALRIFVDADERTTVVGEARDGAEALALCQQLRPEIVLMDIQMPVMDGVTATERISRGHPETRVLALTTFSSERHVVSMLRAGASGYLVKDTAPEQLVQGIVDVRDWRSALSPQISHALVRTVRAPAADHARVPSDVTGRELSILQLLAQGKSNAEIAAELNLAETTVKANFGRIMTKWGVRDRVQVLIRATQLGVVTL